MKIHSWILDRLQFIFFTNKISKANNLLLQYCLWEPATSSSLHPLLLFCTDFGLPTSAPGSSSLSPGGGRGGEEQRCLLLPLALENECRVSLELWARLQREAGLGMAIGLSHRIDSHIMCAIRCSSSSACYTLSLSKFSPSCDVVSSGDTLQVFSHAASCMLCSFLTSP